MNHHLFDKLPLDIINKNDKRYKLISCIKNPIVQLISNKIHSHFSL